MLYYADDGSAGRPLTFGERVSDWWKGYFGRYYILPFRYLRQHFRDCRQQQQVCKVCGQADGWNFNVPDEVWTAVVPKRWQDHVVCLKCFDDFAASAGIDYRDNIELCFAGKYSLGSWRIGDGGRSVRPV